mmetsp:Transcript_6156/g.5503  ORF Transcript_6156/g.5503 Transcript_6156/m.5503 type:complete len:179 (-) Transcript_6156:55-591(-)
MNIYAGTYEGSQLVGRFMGNGKYKYKDYVYEGAFFDGLFHGQGTLYVKKGKFEGLWEKGKLIEGGFVFEDGLKHRQVENEYWDYCSIYDPRFHHEIESGIELGDPLVMETPLVNPPTLPEGCYDVLEGYYDPKKNTVMSYTIDEPIRKVSPDEHDWIIKNCRYVKKSEKRKTEIKTQS